MRRWLRDELYGFRLSWYRWQAGESTGWQALWGHNVEPWWKVPGFMKRWR